MSDTTKDDGGQAFPRAGFDGPTCMAASVEGMTLRDYFAGQVIGALCARIGPGPVHQGPAFWARSLADDAYQLADALLAARTEAK